MSEAEGGAVAAPPAPGGEEQTPPDKIRIVGIRSHFEARPRFHLVNGLRLRVGDRVIVDAGEGEIDFGEVAESTRVMEARYFPQPLRTVIRRASEEDLKRLAHNERLQCRSTLNPIDYLLGGIPATELVQVLIHFLREWREVAIDKIGRAEGNIVGKAYFTTYGTYGIGLMNNAPRDIIFCYLIIRSFHVNVWLQHFNGFKGKRPAVNRHVIHIIKPSNRLCPEVLRKGRPVRALVNMLITREGHDQHVPHPTSLFKVTNMPDVQQIKHAVRKYNLLARGS